MEGLLLPVCSIFFSALLCFVYFFKKRVNLIENKMYSIMIICILIDSILVSILHCLPLGNLDSPMAQTIIPLFNKIDFILLSTYVSCLFMYLSIITVDHFRKNSFNFIKVVCLVNVFFFIMIALSSVNVISLDGHYSVSGSSTWWLACCVGMYIFASLAIVLMNIKKVDIRHIPIGCVILMLVFLMLITQYNPYLIVISISLTFINFIMYFTIENPDVKMVQQLEIAREQAEKANRAKTDFLSSMSHEIRTPLNAIVGFSDCIMDSNNIDDAKENAKDIVSASGTLLEIVNGILDISKIEAGKVEIINSTYNPKEVFLELAKLITPKMSEKGLDFTYNIANDLPDYLYGDHANIKKVVTNLLSNACKYTESGFVHYEVSCVNSSDISRLIISVEDSGRGIKKENVEKLFTKFQRLDEDRNTTIEGTGLGLAITKQLVELMGGQIIVHTVYKEGSKFTVILNQKIDKNPINNEKKLKDTLNLENVKILLVDDTNLNIKVAVKLLERYNANMITTCISGFECIDRIMNGEKYDVILLDDMMPKMSGVETLQKLKQIEGFNMPVVALTANAITGMREKYLKDGFDDYLAKPIEKDQLIHVMNKILDRSVTSEINSISYNEPIIQRSEDIVKEEKVEELEDNTNPNIISVVDINKPIVYDRTYLEANGVLVNHALELLGDMEMYNMTIKDFYADVSKKWDKIVEYKNQNNMSDYAIEVHSLKSDCKYLGFMRLADISYQHELKSKANDVNYVISNFNELEEEYHKVFSMVKEYVEHIN